MTHRATSTIVLVLTFVLSACPTAPPSATKPSNSTRGDVRDSAYTALDRTSASPPGFGLYTVVLTRSASRQATRVLTEVFATTPALSDAALAADSLNLIVLPVKDANAANVLLANARDTPDPTATALLGKHYDYGQAALLLASLCRTERGPAVMRACGSGAPDGPILVTGTRPLDPASPLFTQRLLVVNLAQTPPAALGEAMAAYRRQITSRDPLSGAETSGWRLRILNASLEVAGLLPFVTKAYAGTP